jgi:hypothetical protein
MAAIETTRIPGKDFDVIIKTVTSSDYAGMLVGQSNLAGQLFGLTAVNRAGRTDAVYPRMSGDYAGKLLRYWLQRLPSVMVHAEDIPDSAVRSQWLRDVQGFSDAVMPLFQVASKAGLNLIADTRSVEIWDLLDVVVLPMRAIKDTPTKFEIAMQALKESLQDLGKLGNSGLLMLGKIALGLFGAKILIDAITRRE